MKKTKFLFFAFSFLFFYSAYSQNFYKETPQSKHWVDSVYKSLSKKQRVAQLMIIRAHSNLGQEHINSVIHLIKKYNVGGLCFFQGGPARQANLTNYYQSIAQTALMITIDAEWGLGMRLDSVQNFPRQMMMGAMDIKQGANTVIEFGTAVAKQCKRMGIHVNFAPVVDVNNNPANPVINDRSFGEDKHKVAVFGSLYVQGLQQQNVMACAKHFPGHGDVAVDSHLDLPVINKSIAQLNDVELYPFKELIKQNVGSMMMAHLYLPNIDSTPNQASSLSKVTVTNLLKEQMSYKGLTFTDALEMKGVSKFYPAGEASVQSLIAGNDMLCLPGDVKGSIKKTIKALRKGIINKQDFEARVKKVLLAKYNLGLNNFIPIETENLVEDLNKETATITQQIAKQSITLVKQTNPTIFPLPFTKDNKDVLPKIAYIAIGNGQKNIVTEQLQQAWNADIYYYNNTYNKADSIKETIEPMPGVVINDTKEKYSNAKQIIEDCLEKGYDYVLVGVHQYNRRPANNFGLGNAALYLLKQFENNNNALYLFFGNPYAIKQAEHAKNIIACYEDDIHTQAILTEILKGNMMPQGSLPVTVSDDYKVGSSALKKKPSNQ